MKCRAQYCSIGRDGRWEHSLFNGLSNKAVGTLLDRLRLNPTELTSQRSIKIASVGFGGLGVAGNFGLPGSGL